MDTMRSTVIALHNNTNEFDLKRTLDAVMKGEMLTSRSPSFDPATGFARGKPFSADRTMQQYVNNIIKKEFPYDIIYDTTPSYQKIKDYPC